MRILDRLAAPLELVGLLFERRRRERMWADVRRAARVAREEGVTLTVHGIEVSGKPKRP